MKKVKLLTFALSCSLLLGAGISSFTFKDNKVNNNEISFTTKGQYELKETFNKLAVTPDVSEIKYLVSIDGTKALLATAFNDTVYNQVGAAATEARENPSIGYDINGTETDLTNVVYEGIKTNNGVEDKIWRAEDIFGAEYEGYHLTVAEMDFNDSVTYVIESFARVKEDKIVSKERTLSAGSVAHHYVDTRKGYTACTSCGKVESIYENHVAGASLLKYEGKTVGTTDGLFGDWTSNKYTITEIESGIVWMGKVSEQYSEQYFNAGDDVQGMGWVAAQNWVYDAYLRTTDDNENVTQTQLIFGCNEKKFAIPIYSNGGINLFDDHSAHSFVDGAFRTFAMPSLGDSLHVQVIYYELGENKAQLTFVVDGYVVNTLEIESILDQRNFGFDMDANSHWEIGSPKILVINNYVDTGKGYLKCDTTKDVRIYANHEVNWPKYSYEDKEVGTVEGLFGDWTTGQFKITEINNGIVWMGKNNEDYCNQYFNAGDDRGSGWKAPDNYIYDAYLRTTDSGTVTQIQLYIGAPNDKYAIPVYSNGGINLWQGDFVAGAFANFNMPAVGNAFHLQVINYELEGGRAQLTFVIDGQFVNTIEIPSTLGNREFGFDLSAGNNWEIGSPKIFVIE